MAQARAPPRPLCGELFVPYDVVPTGGGAGREADLAVRVRSVEGLQAKGARLSLALRFGPPCGARGAGVSKSQEVSVKCCLVLVRGGPGKWVPEGGSGIAHVVLPPALLQNAARMGIACRVKVLSPGVFMPKVFGASAAMHVPLEPAPVPLAAKGGTSATAVLSISRLFTADAQAAVVRDLAQRLLTQLQPQQVRSQGSGSSDSLGAGGIPRTLVALRPSCGWLPAAGVTQALATCVDGRGRSALRLAVDNGHWPCVRPLLQAACDPRALSGEDLRSPLTAALERGFRPEDILPDDLPGALAGEEAQVASELAAAVLQIRSDGGFAAADVARRWEALADTVAHVFRPPPPGAEAPPRSAIAPAASGRPPPPPSSAPSAGSPSSIGSGAIPGWSGDMYVLALEHCPTGRARRRLLCAEGACAALWRVSLSNNLPSLARKLAVWIGLSVNNAPNEAAGSPQSRRLLLDVPLDPGARDAMLARVLQRGMEDERWLKVARAMVHLGAAVTGATASGRPLLDLALTQADHGHSGFRDLTASLLEKLGDGVDHWEHPTVLAEENPAECPICMEVLWTATPTAFVSFSTRGGVEGNPHVICAHFFCFDCASQQYMKQQSQNVEEFECPICRAPAREVMPLPDITVNPRLWFQFLDVDGSGTIVQNTVVQTLEAMLPIDTENLREALEQSVWKEWDKTGDRQISEREFFDTGGLLEWVRGHQHELKAAQARGQAPPLAEPERWFRHWDTAKRGRLRRGEVLRALCEEARISSLEPKRVERLKEGIQKVWEEYAVEDMLSRDAFLHTKAAEELAAVAAEVKAKRG